MATSGHPVSPGTRTSPRIKDRTGSRLAETEEERTERKRRAWEAHAKATAKAAAKAAKTAAKAARTNQPNNTAVQPTKDTVVQDLIADNNAEERNAEEVGYHSRGN
jgi:FKBP-type peptidyl-prolyl cis-trans isomerase